MNNRPPQMAVPPPALDDTRLALPPLPIPAVNPGTCAEDDRLEYTQICDNLRAGVTVLWDAFKTYFTVTAFLFAGFAFLYSDACPLEGRAGAWASVAIAVAGGLINVLSGLGIGRILAYQKRFLLRGEELERNLAPAGAATLKRVVGQAHEEWLKGRVGAPALTLIVFAIFTLPWGLAGWHSLQLKGFELRHQSKPLAVELRR